MLDLVWMLFWLNCFDSFKTWKNQVVKIMINRLSVQLFQSAALHWMSVVRQFITCQGETPHI